MRAMYKITDELDNARDEAYQSAEENGGEISDYLADVLDNLEGEREDKLLGVASGVKEIKLFISQLNGEKKRITALEKRYSREAEGLMEYIVCNTEGGEKLQSPQVAISWRKSESIEESEDFNIDHISDEWLTIKTTKSLDKTSIKLAIKTGAVIEGVILQKNMKLQIK